jgi:hypothetical protein
VKNNLIAARLAACCAAVIALAGCSQSASVITPASPSHLYVSDFFGGFDVFATPLGPASAAVASQTFTGGAAGAAVDSAGDFYIDDPNSVFIYTPPVTSTSTPTQTITIAGALNLFGIAFDAAGGLYVADANPFQIYFFPKPYSAPPTTTFSGPPPFQPTHITFGPDGNLYVSNFTGSAIDVFHPPFTAGVNTPTATIAITKSPPFGVTFDGSGRLVVGLVDGELAVINPPFATGATPAFYVPAPTINGAAASDAGGPTIDSSGNFVVPYGSNGGSDNGLHAGVAVFAQPLSASSAPLFVFQSGLIQPVASAFGK